MPCRPGECVRTPLFCVLFRFGSLSICFLIVAKDTRGGGIMSENGIQEINSTQSLETNNFFSKWTCGVLLTCTYFMVLFLPWIWNLDQFSRVLAFLGGYGVTSLFFVAAGAFVFFIIFKFALKKQIKFIVFYNIIIMLAMAKEIVSLFLSI